MIHSIEFCLYQEYRARGNKILILLLLFSCKTNVWNKKTFEIIMLIMAFKQGA